MDYYNAGYGQFGNGGMAPQQQSSYQQGLTAPAVQQQAAQPDELCEGMVIHSTPQFEAPEGDYNFYVAGWTTGFFQPKNPESKIPPCKTVDYTLKIPYMDLSTGQTVYGQTTYSLKLTPILMNVLAKFFESTGAVPEYSEFAIDFNLPVGRTGVCNIEQRAGATSVYSTVRDVYRPSQRPAVTMNDGIPFDQPQATYGA